MDYRDWEILKVLYHQKNLTKTARLLFLTQPALTTRLKHMQEELGVKIVTRESRGVHFTPQGEYLVHCAEEALAHYEKIKENVQNMSHTESDKVVGTLKLGVSNFFANYALPYVLKLFKMQYPHVEFKVTTGWSRDVTQLIHNKDVHISFVRGDYGWRGLSKQQLFEEKICIASMNEIDIMDLPSLPRIEYRGDYLLKSIIDHWWGENYSQAPFISIEVDQVDTCKEMVINGLGYGILSSRVLTGIEDLHKIHLLDQEGNPILRRTWMYYHKESLEWNVVKAFVRFIENFDWKDN
ncbi:LysR family transcriptional regulator [Bacillus sp. ISL-40]|uniref:LysR family transcriptional regulator n=1 Tax=unclassified Bacillus (in: firmicutes) TaxID=185979 RepID=UPI001BEB7F24|nr:MULTISPECIES: LysR family transcriptional regulator [unclassified Bacillus (in: firmicutes)]MBT2700469.1 LysR family transcriptional regulator [Bacillus sp. ISL-40]MBT2720496.1 LysR family transcriptional regulator [Bacillus sp. ISL-46]MBT2744226.1 LysR family transcriptional regulator [Bacillus sp. ISL-77]